MSLVLVALIQTEPTDPTNVQLTVEVIDPDGSSSAPALLDATLPESTRLGCVIAPIGVPLQVFGRHIFMVGSTAGIATALALDIQSPG